MEDEHEDVAGAADGDPAMPRLWGEEAAPARPRCLGVRSDRARALVPGAPLEEGRCHERSGV